jgi:hypothetical protein
MHTTKYFLFTVVFLCIFGHAKTQDLLFEDIKSEMSAEQLDEIEKAERGLERISSYITKAEAIESEYSKFKNSNKKRHKKKYEKKTWEAKKFRTTAENLRQKSYATAVNVYSDLIESLDFYYEEDEEEALRLNQAAQNEISNAEKILAKYDEAESRRDYKKEVSHSSLLSNIANAQQAQEEALNNQFETLELYLAQKNKRDAEERDNAAWQRAKREHTISAYNRYIDNFPRGKYVNAAREEIAKLEELARIEAEKNKNPESLYTFKIQIAASRIPLSDEQIREYYDDPSKVSQEYTENYYKYRVGTFTDYASAHQFLETLMQSRSINYPYEEPFIVAFDREDNQVEVTNEMKPEHLRD